MDAGLSANLANAKLATVCLTGVVQVDRAIPHRKDGLSTTVNA